MTHPAREAEQIKESPAEGVYIHGLYLDGCAWSGRENKLVDAEPKKLFNPLPVLYVTGVLVRDPGCNGSVVDVCLLVVRSLLVLSLQHTEPNTTKSNT